MSGKEKAEVAKKESEAPAKQRTIPEIEADIAASRERLVQTVSQLEVTVKRNLNPKRILAVQVKKVQSFYVDEYGGVRPERVVVTVGVVVGFVVVRKVTKRVFSK